MKTANSPGPDLASPNLSDNVLQGQWTVKVKVLPDNRAAKGQGQGHDTQMRIANSQGTGMYSIKYAHLGPS